MMPYGLVWSTFAFLCVIVTTVAYGITFHLQTFNKLRDIGYLYMNLVEGTRVKNYYLSTRTDLLFAIYIGEINDTILSDSGIASFSSYLQTENIMIT
jgi:hypothetical protein